MTRRGARKTVDASFWQGRLAQGVAFRHAARDGMAIAESGNSGSPVISNLVLAAIAFCDAMTAKRANVVNQQDHAAAPKLLRQVLGNALPAAQETQFKRILGYKDQSQYGAKKLTLAEAQMVLDRLEEFSIWVEANL